VASGGDVQRNGEKDEGRVGLSRLEKSVYRLQMNPRSIDETRQKKRGAKEQGRIRGWTQKKQGLKSKAKTTVEPNYVELNSGTKGVGNGMFCGQLVSRFKQKNGHEQELQ